MTMPMLPRFAFALLSSLAAAPAFAAFNVNSDGTVADTGTGLTWDQCAWGQTGATCVGGAPVVQSWPQALVIAVQANTANYKGHNDWRLPNRTALESLVDLGVANPAIDATKFSATPAEKFWSSTTYAPTPSSAWQVDFNDGNSGPAAKTEAHAVRLVRGGNAFDGLDGISAPVTIAVAVDPANGGSANCSPNPADVGDTVTCTATSNVGYGFTGWTGGCAASFTAANDLNCTAHFASTTSVTLPLPRGGSGQAVVIGGCTFESARFVPSSSIAIALPSGVHFAADLFDFTLANCPKGGTATVQITYPTVLPSGARYWKFGPTPGNETDHWYAFASATITGNSVTLTIADGALGDDDLAANGRIVDAGGPTVTDPPVPTPALPGWRMLLLIGSLILVVACSQTVGAPSE